MDLLLHLIDKAEVDIYEVSISTITEQYLTVLEEAKAWNMEIASEFMVMAATLLSLKSRMLLPPTIKETEIADDEGDWLDPREELIERLLVYKQFKRLGDQLEELESEQSRVYSRLPLDLTPFTPTKNPLEGISPDDLWKALFALLEQKKNEPEPSLTKLAREEISVSDRMEQIFEELLQKGELWFSNILESEMVTRERLITTFLAILELMKTKPITCRQGELFSDICIRLVRARESV
ncbi:segregation and condensation protein A [Shimazuella alba]|uniref:segregation and condensation protein A n=1 Tax=Shimazuella alba TaxID=2690964 RepID=UPI00192771E0|nr:segregation/condensation protein A [Shimazuella alba]